jgi:hypothetical protein
MAVTPIPGTNNFMLSPLLLATITPNTGPKIIAESPKAADDITISVLGSVKTLAEDDSGHSI